MFLKSNCLIHGSQLEGLWKDIGRPSDLLDANIRMADRKGSSICVGGARCSGRIVASLMQAENALIEGPAYIGYGATLGKETMLSSSAVGDGANIGDECKINGSFLMERCNLGRSSNVQGSLLRWAVLRWSKCFANQVHRWRWCKDQRSHIPGRSGPRTLICSKVRPPKWRPIFLGIQPLGFFSDRYFESTAIARTGSSVLIAISSTKGP